MKSRHSHGKATLTAEQEACSCLQNKINFKLEMVNLNLAFSF